MRSRNGRQNTLQDACLRVPSKIHREPQVSLDFQFTLPSSGSAKAGIEVNKHNSFELCELLPPTTSASALMFLFWRPTNPIYTVQVRRNPRRLQTFFKPAQLLLNKSISFSTRVRAKRVRLRKAS